MALAFLLPGSKYSLGQASQLAMTNQCDKSCWSETFTTPHVSRALTQRSFALSRPLSRANRFDSLAESGSWLIFAKTSWASRASAVTSQSHSPLNWQSLQYVPSQHGFQRLTHVLVQTYTAAWVVGPQPVALQSPMDGLKNVLQAGDMRRLNNHFG